LDWLQVWWPWLAIAAVPGIINLLVAFQELDEECRFLPFFEPYKNLGVWLWALFQLLLPMLLFWLSASLGDRPSNFLELIVEALVFGFGFVAILNSRTEIGTRIYNLKSIYIIVIGVAYQMIARNQTSRTAQFWTDVETGLRESADLTPGFRFLENYFASDVSIPLEEKESFQTRILDAQTASREQGIRDGKNLLRDVRRRDLPQALRRFGASSTVLTQYFGRRG
jgi:hypothetical protein